MIPYRDRQIVSAASFYPDPRGHENTADEMEAVFSLEDSQKRKSLFAFRQNSSFFPAAVYLLASPCAWSATIRRDNKVRF
jgi:hypothetical protein